MRAIQQIWRGLGYLPGVGAHPGTFVFCWFVAMGAFAGANSGGAIGMFGGAAIVAAGLGPLYLWGAYARAQISDRMTRRGEQ